MKRALALALLCACMERDRPPVATPTILEAREVVPSPGLPDLALFPANNNLDVVRHEGRVYLAFRNAPNHFAGTKTRMHIVSSGDERVWRHEATFFRGTDLREPRFLSWNGRLFLYFAVLGSDPFSFEPQGMMVSEKQGGTWTEPEWFHEPGFIPWRAKVVNGVPYLLAYVGGENIYEPGGHPIEVHWLTTSDGRTFRPVVAGRPAVLRGGGSETDFVIQDDGSIVAVVRNEAGDAMGWGSKVCRAEAGTPGDWRCAGDPRKFDSPLLFRHGRTISLVARRNLTATGYYDLMMRDLPPDRQTLLYQADYWQRPKRCALWRVDPDALEVELVLDLPSRGDTCFPALLDLGAGEYALYNYSSPLEGEDVSWLAGQLGPTRIYRLLLALPPG